MSGSRELISRKAVQAVELAFVRELGWYPREPPAPDYGIDLYVEAAIDGVPNGRMLGVQIKGGTSFFSAKAGDAGVVFRGEERHLDYWLGHSLPVIVVLHEPSSGTILWQVVTPERRSPPARAGSSSYPGPSSSARQARKSYRSWSKATPTHQRSTLYALT